MLIQANLVYNFRIETQRSHLNFFVLTLTHSVIFCIFWRVLFLSLFFFICHFDFLAVYMFLVCTIFTVFVCFYFHLFICFSVCQFICFYFYLFICFAVCQFICPALSIFVDTFIPIAIYVESKNKEKKTEKRKKTNGLDLVGWINSNIFMVWIYMGYNKSSSFLLG